MFNHTLGHSCAGSLYIFAAGALSSTILTTTKQQE